TQLKVDDKPLRLTLKLPINSILITCRLTRVTS
ncbi:unnamed protein product, partial [Rotaria magnacalcarata]